MCEKLASACVGILTLCTWIRVCSEFDVVAGKQPLPPIKLSFPPITVVLIEHVDHLTLLEGELVVVLGHIIIHADDLTQSFQNTESMSHRFHRLFTIKELL